MSTTAKRTPAPPVKAASAAAAPHPPAGPAAAPPPAKQIPASPRKVVPQARTLTKSSAGVRDAVAGCIGKSLVVFSLAQIRILQDDSGLREETPVFDNESDDAPERPWQTFDNIVADGSDKLVKTPITVTTDVKMALTSLYIGIADLINHTGKLSVAAPVKTLTESPFREANIVGFLDAVVAQMRPLLKVDPLSRELGYPALFRQKLEVLVSSKALVDPGSETIARLFVDFLKAIAWHAATIAYEHEHLTLNRSTLFAIIGQMGSVVSESAVPMVRDVLSFMRTQVEGWEVATATRKAAQKKTQAKLAAGKAPAAKPTAAKPATTAAKPATTAAKPPTTAAKPPTTVAKPPTTVAKPPTAAKPPTTTPPTAEPTAAPAAEPTAAPAAEPAVATTPAPAAEPAVATTPAPAAKPPTVAAKPPAAAAKKPVAPELEYDQLLDELDSSSPAPGPKAVVPDSK